MGGLQMMSENANCKRTKKIMFTMLASIMASGTTLQYTSLAVKASEIYETVDIDLEYEDFIQDEYEVFNADTGEFETLSYEEFDNFLNVSLDINTMTPAQRDLFDQAVEEGISRQARNLKETPEEIRNQVLQIFDSNTPTKRLLALNISNSTVSIVINAAIAVAIGGASAAAMKTYMQKKGKDALLSVLGITVVRSLTNIANSKVAQKSSQFILQVVSQLLDPGAYIANKLDQNDYKGKNGQWNVKI